MIPNDLYEIKIKKKSESLTFKTPNSLDDVVTATSYESISLLVGIAILLLCLVVRKLILTRIPAG